MFNGNDSAIALIDYCGYCMSAGRGGVAVDAMVRCLRTSVYKHQKSAIGFLMSLTHDRKFIVSFDLLVGILVGLFAGTLLIVGFLAGRG